MLAVEQLGCIWPWSCTSQARQQVHEMDVCCGCRWQGGQWGYACCHQTTKNSYCTGEAGQLAQQAQAEQMQANVERKAQEDAQKAEHTLLEVRIRAVSSLQASCQALPRLRTSARLPAWVWLCQGLQLFSAAGLRCQASAAAWCMSVPDLQTQTAAGCLRSRHLHNSS